MMVTAEIVPAAISSSNGVNNGISGSKYGQQVANSCRDGSIAVLVALQAQVSALAPALSKTTDIPLICH